jgi:phosphoenolpyruvate-protein kinase (PTS system EI component)
MIATLDEFREAKTILEDEKQKLLSEGQKVSDEIELGIMVEIPSTAILADQFAKEVDFFSIGTNDLIQYTMAADRMNQRVSYLYQPYSPSILRLVKMVIDAALSRVVLLKPARVDANILKIDLALRLPNRLNADSLDNDEAVASTPI